jgi:hypothetical protein
MTREVIIFVHGTGADSLDTHAPRWWQPISTFSRRFLEHLGQSYCIAKPFRWSGANLESHRRDAGICLLQRLRALDARGRSYHLVGHSHGGSVIWHALIRSMSHDLLPLTGLKSWTTVGTPFLTFVLDPTAWRNFVGLLVSGAAIVFFRAAAVGSVTQHSVIWKESSPWGVSITFLMFVILAMIFATCLLRTLRYLWQRYQERALADAEIKAGKQYGSKWLGIWHEYDEPIAGLRATLTDPMQLVSRKAGNSTGLLGRAIWFWYDFGVVPVANQWAWAIGMSHAQGSDVFSWRMARAWSAPTPLQPGWAPLPASVASPIAASADAKAAMASSVLRSRLRALGDYSRADDAIASLAAVMSWQELIHTSYFEHQSIDRLIGGHILDTSGVHGIGNVDDELDQWRRSRPVTSAEMVVKHGHQLALPIARLARLLGTTILITVAASASYSAWVAPFTDRAQVEEINRRTLGPSLLVAENSSGLSETIVRLFALGRISDTVDLMRSIAGSNKLTAERMATALGFAYPSIGRSSSKSTRLSAASSADGEPIETVVWELDQLGSGGLPTKDAARVKLASAMVTAGKPIPAEAVDSLASSLRGAETKERWIRRRASDDYDGPDTETVERDLTDEDLAIIAEGAAILYYLARADDAEKLVEIVDRHLGHDKCTNAQTIAVQVAAFGSAEIIGLVNRCAESSQREAIFFEAALSALASGHKGVSKALFSQTSPASRKPGTAVQLWYWLALELDQGHVDDAVALVETLLESWRNSPINAMGGRVVELAGRFRAAGKPDVAIRIINEMLDIFQHDLRDEPPFGSRSFGEVANILSAENRKVELLELARELGSRAAAMESVYIEEKASLHVSSAAVYEIGAYDAGAIDQLDQALKITIISNSNYKSQFETACSITSIASSVGQDDLVLRGIDRAMKIIENVPSFGERVDYYLALSRRAAVENQLYLARRLAELSSYPDKVLSGYAQILDSYLKKNDLETWRKWGLSQLHQIQMLNGDTATSSAAPVC